MKTYWKLLCVLLVLVLISGCTACEAQPSEPQLSLDSQLTGPLVLGDRMPELSVTTPEGDSLVLSQLLQQKKVVVLNFWYADCIWCVREFPVMEVSYQKYKQDVEILALNPFDSTQSIAAFQE